MKKEIIKSNMNEQKLFTELATLIEKSKKQVVAQVNSILTLTYWQVGKKVNEHILEYNRALSSFLENPQDWVKVA